MNVSATKLLAVFGIALILAFSFGSTAFAIKYGQPDGPAHPYVCWTVTWDNASEWVYLGTGSLIASNVVLTAGHITQPPGGMVYAWVSFDPTADWPPWDPSSIGWIDVTANYTHPDYCIGCGTKGLTDWITHDVGILILDEEVILSEYAALPSEGQVNTLSMKEAVDLVGYGVQYQVRGLGIPPSANWDWIDFGYRYNATAQLIASKHILNDEFLRLTANPGQGTGGTCFGDSGSPILLAGTNTIMGVCSWGTNGNCAGTSYHQRIDTTDILEWIDDFLP